MIDWKRSMQQTYEYFEVDPNTWGDRRKIDTIISSSVSFDLNSDTLATANVELTENVGEMYIRIYLVATQDGDTYRFCLGTYLIQTPNLKFDGKVNKISADAYSPLLELKEKYVPLGFSIAPASHILETVSDICREVTRAPVIASTGGKIMEGLYLSEVGDTYMKFLTDALSVAQYRFDLDDTNRILFAPKQDNASLRPVWTFDDGNSSILYSDISMEKDLYGIPNVVEVLYSSNSGYMYSRVENNEEGNPLSIEGRGREIVHRDSNPSFSATPTQAVLDQYAEQLLRNLSTIESKITYKHGYCPVRIGDSVRLNYSKAGVNEVIAKVTSQKISCVPGCPVEETAVFSSSLYNVR